MKDILGRNLQENDMVFLIKDPFLALANPSEHSLFALMINDNQLFNGKSFISASNIYKISNFDDVEMQQYNRLVEAYKEYNLRKMERSANSKNIKAGSVVVDYLNQEYIYIGKVIFKDKNLSTNTIDVSDSVYLYIPFFTYIDKDTIISQSMFKNFISNVIHYLQTHDSQQDIINLFKKDGIKITKVKSKVNFKYNVQLEQKYTFNYIVNNCKHKVVIEIQPE